MSSSRIIYSKAKGTAQSGHRRVYKKLFKALGPQGWWPVTIDPGRPPAYRPLFYGPHTDSAMFEICVGAILTQNTAWANALAALAGLGGAGMMSPVKLSALPSAGLCSLIRSSGFYRQKALRLKKFSRYIISRHPEGLEKWFLGAAAEDLRAELLTINGIGPETADSMVLYAGRKAKFVVDAYTHRVFGRLGFITGTYASLQEGFETALPRDHRVYNEYHALIVALGKSYCRKSNPVCAKCPLKSMCAAGRA